MELFLQKNGRYSFVAAEQRKVIVVDEEKESRKVLQEWVDNVLPKLGDIDRLIRFVDVAITKNKVIFSFKIKRRFYQALIDRERLTDEKTVKRIFTNILKRELRDLAWVR